MASVGEAYPGPQHSIFFISLFSNKYNASVEMNFFTKLIYICSN